MFTVHLVYMEGAYCKTIGAPKTYYNHGNCTDISVTITLLITILSTFVDGLGNGKMKSDDTTEIMLITPLKLQH